MNENQSIINLDSLLNLSAQLNGSFDCNSILKAAMLSLMGKLKIPFSQAFILKNDNVIEIHSGKKISRKFAEKLFPYLNNIQSCDIIEINNDVNLSDSSNLDGKYHYIINLKNFEQNIGLILFGEKIDKSILSEEEKYYAKIVAQITSIALSNAINFQNIENHLREIEWRNLLFQNLLNISNDFLSFGSEENIIKTFSLNLMGQLKLNHYALFLKSKSSFAQIINKFNFDFQDKLINEFAYNFDETASKIQSHYTEVNYIFPLYYQSELRGVLLLGDKMNSNEFSNEDFLFTEMLSNTFITALENYRLMQEEIKKQEIERDLALAKGIQERLLPKSFPQKRDWDFYGVMKPSQMVGGDYFDYIELNENEILVIVADVSGKGIAASLLMANLQASLHSFSLLNLNVNDIVKNINQLLYQNTAEDKFITLFIGKLNCNAATLSYINAGHNPPILISGNNVIELSKGCLPLGIEKEINEVEIGNVTFHNGDILAIYTDGIVEATNSQKIEYGKEKLIENLFRFINSSINEMSEKILIDLFKFINGDMTESNEMVFKDDITLNIIKRK
jgi:sigma-B regulation protein RsbU (phosphoserine phosphatase)